MRSVPPETWRHCFTFLVLMPMFQSLLSCHPAGITSHTTLVIPDGISSEAASLLHEVEKPLLLSVEKARAGTVTANSVGSIWLVLGLGVCLI